VERRLVDVTAAWVSRLKSKELANVLTRILDKVLKTVAERKLLMTKSGRILAIELSDLAMSWGNQRARQWRNDKGFHLFLGHMVNTYV